MMRSLFSGVSGLKSHQTRMDVIGNNISNINTVGFKSSRTTFADMLSQTTKGASSPNTSIGGTNPVQIGLGAAVASIDLITSDGSPQNTGKNTDVALSGNGMFVLKNGDQYYYSRDGAFEFDNDGNYVLPGSGLYVQGWNAIEGALNTNSNPTNIVVPAGRTMAAAATTSVDFSGNLNASTPVITGITYTDGGLTASPSSVVMSKTVNSISVGDANSLSYDSRWIQNCTITYITDPATGDTATYTPSADDQGKLYTKNGTITVGGVDYTISQIDYTEDGTVTPLTSDTKMVIRYANGETSTVSPPTTAQIGSSATTPLNATSTITSIRVTDVSGKNPGYPKSVVASDGNVQVTYTNESGTVEAPLAVNYGTYAVGQEVPQTVNVDGTNVISAILTLSDGTTQKVTSGFYELGHSIPVTTIITIYDSEGKEHEATLLMDKDNISEDANANADARDLGNENRWRIYISPGEGKRGPASTFSKDEDDGSHTDGYFNVVSDANGNPVDGDVSYVYFNEDGSYSSAASQSGSIFLTYSNGNGAASTTSSVDFTGLTQYSGNSTAYPSADGNKFGVLQSVAIDTSGVVTGTYTNGVRRFEAQIAVAQFVNSSGLTKTGTSLYQESNNSGTANIKTVTDLGLSITPSALEMSNVDLASELADMIVTQRGFQSNSKIISVGDEMLETLINMKR